MSILFFIPAFLIFIYSLYKLAKDDYIFIRRNISSEQMLDIAFIVTWVSLFSSRLVFIILHPTAEKNIFFSFFSLQADKFSLLGLVIGGAGALYFIGKYRKLPVGRLFDFFTIAFTAILPIGYLTAMLFAREYILLLYFVNALIYSFFAYYFIKYIQPKNTIFLFFFSLMFLANSLLLQILNKSNFITIENILSVVLIFASLVLLFKQK